MIIYNYFSSVFCIVPKKVLLLKYRKWVSHLKIRYHYAEVVENAIINFLISCYCTLLFSKKENFKFLEAALSAVLRDGPVGYVVNAWGYQHWNAANTTLEICLLFEDEQKSTQTRCNVCSNLTKCTTASSKLLKPKSFNICVPKDSLVKFANKMARKNSCAVFKMVKNNQLWIISQVKLNTCWTLINTY